MTLFQDGCESSVCTQPDHLSLGSEVPCEEIQAVLLKPLQSGGCWLFPSLEVEREPFGLSLVEMTEGEYRQLHQEVAAEGQESLLETGLNTASQAGLPRGGASQQPGLHLREQQGSGREGVMERRPPKWPR